MRNEILKGIALEEDIFIGNNSAEFYVFIEANRVHATLLERAACDKKNKNSSDFPSLQRDSLTTLLVRREVRYNEETEKVTTIQKVLKMQWLLKLTVFRRYRHPCTKKT